MVFADLIAAEYFQQGKAEGRAEAKAEAKAEAILALLAARGLAVDDEARARIQACPDVATLDRWLVRAAAAASAGEVLDPAGDVSG